MELRVRFTGPLLKCSRSVVEDRIEDWLGSSGEVVGAGVATDGSWAHIDLDIFQDKMSDEGLDTVIAQLQHLLQREQVPDSTKIIVFLENGNTLEYPCATCVARLVQFQLRAEGRVVPTHSTGVKDVGDFCRGPCESFTNAFYSWR